MKLENSQSLWTLLRLVSLSFLLCTCSADYTFHEDITDFVNTGLDAVQLSFGSVTADPGPGGENISNLSKAAPGFNNVVYLNIVNPRNFAVTYTFTSNDAASVYDIPPDFNDVAGTISFKPKATATALHFTIGIYVPAINRTYPDKTITLSCAYPASTVQVSGTISGTALNTIVFNPATLSATQNTDVTITVTGALAAGSGWKWYLDGVQQAGASGTFTLNTSQLGDHILGVSTVLGGIRYSGEMRITVSETPTYTVWYDLNGGSGTLPADVTVTQGGSVTVQPIGSITNPGFICTEWNTKSDYSGISWSPGTSLGPISGNVTLFAHWILP